MQQEIPGFKIFMIYRVPSGHVLNRETCKQYSLIECGSWVSDDGAWLIQNSPEKEGIFELLPLNEKAITWFFNKTHLVEGNISDILKFLIEWKHCPIL